MKIVIPTNSNKGLEDQVADHFGRCLYYIFLNEKGKMLETIENTSEHMGGTGLPPELIFCYAVILAPELLTYVKS